MIGRQWIDIEYTDNQEVLLKEFIKSALPPESIKQPHTDQTEDYLNYFIEQAHGYDSEDTIKAASSSGSITILFSEFISGYSEYETTSEFDQIRVIHGTIPFEGAYLNGDNTTLLCYTLGGEGDIVSNGKVLHCRKYDCAIVDISYMTELRATYGPQWDCALIKLVGKQSKALFSDYLNHLETFPAYKLTFGAGTRFRILIWDLLSPKTNIFSINNKISIRMLMALFTEIDIAIIRSDIIPAITPDIIMQIQTYIDTNYATEITLNSLSKKFNISKYHMSRLFKKYIGKSPIDYLILTRINRAKSLLMDSERPISEIAELVGITNTNNFLYLFKSKEGLTPSEFRKGSA